MVSQEEIIDCIQLINSDKVGPITFHKLVEAYGSPKSAIEALPQIKKFKLFERKSAEKEYKNALSKDIKVITYNDEFYPQNLLQLPDFPPVIYVKGNIEALANTYSLSIVGARNASINGRKTASRIAFELTNEGVLIVSGMARGIDSAGHKGAMHAKDKCGETIAVLGTGVDVIYPSENKELYEQIQINGAIISEYPLGTAPQTQNFPRRNRIVAALSLGTLIVEANLHSGSLITARLANELGKDVFAIPGSVNDPRAQGPNNLIKDGAILTQNSEDILNVLSTNNFCLNIKANKSPRIKAKKVDFDSNKIETTQNKNISVLDYLNYEGIYVDELIRITNISSAELSLILLDLEMLGKIERQAGNKVALIKK